MKRRKIIGRNDQGYYYYISNKIEGKWMITIEMYEKEAEKAIKRLLNDEISALHTLNNLLIVKTNDDLVVIENYSQINHDKVFKDFNELVKRRTINKDLFNKTMKLQKTNNHKKAFVRSKILSSAVLMGILLVQPVSPITIDEVRTDFEMVKANITTGFNYNKPEPTPTTSKAIQVEPVDDKLIKEAMLEKKKVAEQNEKRKQEDLLTSKIKEYSAMFNIEYDRARTLVEENATTIKNEYPNQEVGIIRTLAKEFYNNNNIKKTPERQNITSLEREKLLLQFAKVHGVSDIETAATLLAVYRLETGNGSSPACINGNNFGGLRARNTYTGRYYVMDFKTPKIGAEAMVNSFMNIREKTLNSQYYNPNRPLEQNLNRIYCGESSWPTKVAVLKKEVINDYNLNEYVNNEKPKQLIK